MSIHVPLRRYLAILLLSVFCLAALWFSGPRFYAGLRFVPVELALSRYFEDRILPSDRLQSLIKFADQAIKAHDHNRYRDGLSLLHYLRGQDPNTPAMERRKAYRLSEAEALESLRAAPARAATWLRVAKIRALLREEPETVIEPWRMSIFTGRTQSHLMVGRIDLGLQYLDAMDSEALSMLRDQLMLAWRTDRRSVAGVLRYRDPGLAKVRQLIGTLDAAVLAQMEAQLDGNP